MITEKPLSSAALFWIFLKVGSTAFGGFMSLISVVENIIVEKKKLLKHEDMLDGISLASMLPGPVAVNVVAYVGYRINGVRGAITSAIAVILPSFFLIVALTYFYFRWGSVPVMGKIFMGFIPAVTAVILAAAWGMMRKTIQSSQELLIMVIAGIVLLVTKHFFVTLFVIFISGLFGWLIYGKKITGESKIGNATGKRLLSVSPLVTIPFLQFKIDILTNLFLTFAGMSLVLFGGGYVFIPLIQEIVVDGNHWVTQKEFIDAIAMGQITPGPILISAAFIGYKVAGLFGALVATVGIFTPPALVMIGCTRVMEKVKQSMVLRSALRGVRAAVVGMVYAAAVVIATTMAAHWVSVVIFIAAMLAVLKFRIDVVWVIPTAGAIGALLY